MYDNAMVCAQVSADYYHAGMTKTAKSSVQAGWLQGRVKVVCATIAYGTTGRLSVFDGPTLDVACSRQLLPKSLPHRHHFDMI